MCLPSSTHSNLVTFDPKQTFSDLRMSLSQYWNVYGVAPSTVCALAPNSDDSGVVCGELPSAVRQGDSASFDYVTHITGGGDMRLESSQLILKPGIFKLSAT